MEIASSITRNITACDAVHSTRPFVTQAMACAAAVSRGDPRGCVCPLCRGCLFDAASGRLATEPARALRKRLATKRATCECGAEVALSGLRRHLRTCGAVAPSTQALDAPPTFAGHEFLQPALDPDLCAALAAEARRAARAAGKSGRPPSKAKAPRWPGQRQQQQQQQQQQQRRQLGRAGGANGAAAIPEDYDEDEAAQAAIFASILGVEPGGV